MGSALQRKEVQAQPSPAQSRRNQAECRSPALTFLGRGVPDRQRAYMLGVSKRVASSEYDC